MLRAEETDSEPAPLVAADVETPPANAASHVVDSEDVDPDAPAPLSPAAQRAVDSVERDVRSSNAKSVELASPTAPNAYLPKSAGFSFPLPPEPVRFPRTKLNLRLAVLLLRSAYETIDAMDIVPMDQFQIKFWKARQAEWEGYRSLYSPLPIEQGKLEDPLYFDFISYVQFNVIAREIPNSARVFEERSGAEGTVKVIRRDPDLGDNTILPAVFAQRVGDVLYARMRYGFEDERFPGCPEPAAISARAAATADATADADADTDANDFAIVREGLRGVTKCMVEKGYGLSWTVSVLETKGKRQKLKVTVAGPANLWGARALASRGASPPNEYLGYALTAYCRASGVGSSYFTKASETAVELEFTVVL